MLEPLSLAGVDSVTDFDPDYAGNSDAVTLSWCEAGGFEACGDLLDESLGCGRFTGFNVNGFPTAVDPEMHLKRPRLFWLGDVF